MITYLATPVSIFPWGVYSPISYIPSQLELLWKKYLDLLNVLTQPLSSLANRILILSWRTTALLSIVITIAILFDNQNRSIRNKRLAEQVAESEKKAAELKLNLKKLEKLLSDELEKFKTNISTLMQTQVNKSLEFVTALKEIKADFDQLSTLLMVAIEPIEKARTLLKDFLNKPTDDSQETQQSYVNVPSTTEELKNLTTKIATLIIDPTVLNSADAKKIKEKVTQIYTKMTALEKLLTNRG